MTIGEAATTPSRACIHVDMDSVWATAKSFGRDIQIDPDPILQSSTGNFLDLLSRYRVKATFFMTGKDACRRSNAGLIADILAAGHEIANHSMNHVPDFTRLEDRELETEIVTSTKSIEDATGKKCTGFRAPTYNVNGSILRLLQENGYAYDSSILPTFISPLYRTVSVLSRRRAFSYGSIHHARAPLSPYHPDEERVWKRGAMRIVEVPISTMPFFRIPFHCSYALHAGFALFRCGVRLTVLAGLPLVYLFHARELARCDERWSLGFPFKELPFARRKAICEAMLEAITGMFDMVTTPELAAAVAAEEI